MAERDFPPCRLQRERYANSKIKKFHMETVWAWPCIGWIGITRGNLVHVKFDFSVIPHYLWCITEWNSSSWNSLFCLLSFSELQGKAYSCVFTLTANPGTKHQKKKICILHVLTAVSVVGVSFVSPSTIFTSFSSSGNTLGVEESLLLSTSAPVSLWANPAWT